MTSGLRSMDTVSKDETKSSKQNKQNESILQQLQNLETIPNGLKSPTHYVESVVVGEQPFTTSTRTNRVLPVYTLDWTSRTDSYFMPVTGLDFLIGVPEVLLLQTTDDLKSNDSKFLVKIPNGETLYLGMENSASVQRALLCSQRSFNMAFLDPNKQEAVTFMRKAGLTNFKTCFRQELIALMAESYTPLGSIQQDNSFSTISFTILDDQGIKIYKLVCSESTMLRRLHHDVHFSILDPVERTGGVILHKWDDNHKDFVYHITFPSQDTSLQHKILLIGVGLLVVSLPDLNIRILKPQDACVFLELKKLNRHTAEGKSCMNFTHFVRRIVTFD